MSFTKFSRGICLALALSTAMAGQSVLAATGQNVKAKSQTNDISLSANGELRGQVVDQQGRPQALTNVAVFQQQKVVAHTKTDVLGRFAIRGMKPGAYQIQSAVGGKSVRLWAAQTAPPVAQQAVLVVADKNVSRANLGGDVFGGGGGSTYGPAIRGAIAGGLVTGLTYWGLDYNPSGS